MDLLWKGVSNLKKNFGSHFSDRSDSKSSEGAETKAQLQTETAVSTKANGAGGSNHFLFIG